MRYGVVGLGLLAPLLVGAPLGTVVGISFGAPADRLLLWMSLGPLLFAQPPRRDSADTDICHKQTFHWVLFFPVKLAFDLQRA